MRVPVGLGARETMTVGSANIEAERERWELDIQRKNKRIMIAQCTRRYAMPEGFPDQPKPLMRQPGHAVT